MEEYIDSLGQAAASRPVSAPRPPAPRIIAERSSATTEQRARARAIVDALGGQANLRRVEPVALTRLRVELHDLAALDERALVAAGARGTWRLPNDVVHVLLAEDAAPYAAAISAPGDVPDAARVSQTTLVR